MATWESLKRHIKSNYKVANEDLGSVYLIFDTGAGRSQGVVVHRVMLGDDEWIHIRTPVCDERDLQPRDALLRNSDMVVGALELEASGTYWFREAVPLRDLDISEFEEPLGVVVNFGDRLERELSGKDAY